MKIPKFNSFSRLVAGSLAAVFVFMAIPDAAHADPKWKKKHHDDRDNRDDRNDRGDRDDRRDHDRPYYRASRSSYTVTYGAGWRGRGYYYGPPGAAFFYEAPGVAFYSSRGAVPPRYWGGGGDYDRPGSLDARVQRALARRGYYDGPIDGDIGPGTRRAIARYQARNGLEVTGSVTRGLVRSLDL